MGKMHGAALAMARDGRGVHAAYAARGTKSGGTVVAAMRLARRAGPNLGRGLWRFADFPKQCENTGMKKLLTIAATILMSSGLVVGSAKAQDPNSNNTQAPSSQTPAAKPDSDKKPADTKAAPAKKPAAKTPAAKGSDEQASDSKTPAAKASGDKAQTGTATKTPVHHAAAGTPLVLKTEKDKTSYAIGMNIGKSVSKNSMDVDPAIVARGIKDALAGGKTLLTDDEAKAVMTTFQTEMRKKVEDKMQETAAANKKEGDAFLAANKGKAGVITLPSGLQYKIITEASGPKPTAQDTVECNYKGTLLDGTEFDSTAKHGGKPATFPVGGVIKGWTEALQLMPVGSKWQLFIPGDLAYGQRGAGGVIGPNATLVFEVELVSIQAKPAAAAPSK
jgi:FKBP-type peptidyl-prolyl cis-trans isomerase FklB